MTDSKTNNELIIATNLFRELLHRHLEVTNQDDDKDEIATLLYLLATSYIVTSELEAAVKMFHKALDVVQDELLKGKVHSALGQVFVIKDEQKEAKKHYRKAIKLFRKIGDEEGIRQLSGVIAAPPLSDTEPEDLTKQIRLGAMVTCKQAFYTLMTQKENQ